MVACVIYSWLKLWKNYKDQLRIATVADTLDEHVFQCNCCHFTVCLKLLSVLSDAGCIEFVQLIYEFSATLDFFISKKELYSVCFWSALYNSTISRLPDELQSLKSRVKFHCMFCCMKSLMERDSYRANVLKPVCISQTHKQAFFVVKLNQVQTWRSLC